MASSPKDNGKDKVTRFKEYVAALNKQFLDWCTSQIGAKPDKFLTTGITDYLRHSGKLRAQFADVIEEENNSKAGRDSTSYAPLLSLMPVANTKTLHFIRHGEGFHNIGYQTLDSHLTEKGWEQAHALGTHMAAFPSTSGVQLVIVSPMMRCLETAAGVFACDTNTNSPKVGGTKVLMEAQAGEALVRVAHDQIVTPAGLTFVSHELCRERLGPSECDKRRALSAVRPHFPCVDFGLIELDEDTVWKQGQVEPESSVVARGHKFLQYVMSRPETNIAIVTHSAFLWFTLTTFGNEYAKPVRTNLQRWYENCELRTVVLSDGGGMGVADKTWFRGGHAFKEPQQALMEEEHSPIR